MPQVRARRRRRKFGYAVTGVLILTALATVFRFHRNFLVPAGMVSPKSPPDGDLAALLGTDSALKADEAYLLATVNQARRESGVGPLQLSTKLQQIARQHSYDMSASNRFSAEGSDGSSAAQRLQAAGVGYTSMGENIFKGQDSGSPELATRTVKGWLDNAAYRRNLLSPEFNWTGIGIAHGNGGIYVTEDFVKE